MVGQKEMFLKIWEKRKRVCGVCYTPLGNEANAWYFSHTISKGAYPAFKFREKNIDLLCVNCHHIWDHKTELVKEIANFKWMLNKSERLKQQYNWYIKNRLIVDYRIENIRSGLL